MVAADGEVPRDRAPEPPVVAQQLGDPGGVDGLAVLVPDRVPVQEGDRVADVLLVQLGDLELREQELGQRDGQRLEGEPAFEGNLVRHAEAADEDVGLASVLLVDEEEPLAPVQCVEGHVRLIAELAQEARACLRRGARGGEIEVLVGPPEGLGETVLRPEHNGDATQQTKRDTLVFGPCEDPAPLFHDVRQGAVHLPTLRHQWELS